MRPILGEGTRCKHVRFMDRYDVILPEAGGVSGLSAQKETGAIRFCLLLSECNAMWNADNNILRLTCVLATYFAMYNCYVHEKMVFQTIALTSCHMIN